MRKAFTLIELLVVIAIIAILAAILFPVFAQAKNAAKKTKALSSAKQIGTASHLYATDFDDRFPSVYDTGGDLCGGNPECTMQPYMKNGDIWYNNRENTGSRRWTRDATTGGYRAGWSDFGYNWGFEIRSAEGMISGELCVDGGPVVGCGATRGGRFNSGKSITEMANPAGLFAFGDSYDTPRQTIGGDGWLFDSLPTTHPQRNSSLRYGGRMVMVYADTHAGTVAWQGGQWANGVKGRAASPKSFQQRVDGYCADPDGNVAPFPRSGYPLGTTFRCRDFVAILEASGVQWWRD